MTQTFSCQVIRFPHRLKEEFISVNLQFLNDQLCIIQKNSDASGSTKLLLYLTQAFLQLYGIVGNMLVTFETRSIERDWLNLQPYMCLFIQYRNINPIYQIPLIAQNL